MVELWICPNCNLRLRNVIFPVYCRCGVTTYNYRPPTRKPVILSTLAEKNRRKQICLSCPDEKFSKTNYEMCIDIDLGCSNAWKRCIADATCSCPNGHFLGLNTRGIEIERQNICKHCGKGCDNPVSCPEDRWMAVWKDPEDKIPTPTSDLLIITVATGESFQPLLRIVEPSFRKYAQRCGADFVALSNVTQNWWGLEKFRVHAFAKQYKRTLFLDADVCLTSEAPDLFQFVPEGYIGAHPDRKHIKQHRWLEHELWNMNYSQGVYNTDSIHCYNTGIVLTDFPEIWKPPEEPFYPTHCSEQTWVEMNFNGYPVFELPTELNTQWWMDDFFSRMNTAKIIHFANCPMRDRIIWAKEILTW